MINIHKPNQYLKYITPIKNSYQTDFSHDIDRLIVKFCRFCFKLKHGHEINEKVILQQLKTVERIEDPILYDLAEKAFLAVERERGQ